MFFHVRATFKFLLVAIAFVLCLVFIGSIGEKYLCNVNAQPEEQANPPPALVEDKSRASPFYCKKFCDLADKIEYVYTWKQNNEDDTKLLILRIEIERKQLNHPLLL